MLYVYYRQTLVSEEVNSAGVAGSAIVRVKNVEVAIFLLAGPFFISSLLTLLLHYTASSKTQKVYG